MNKYIIALTMLCTLGCTIPPINAEKEKKSYEVQHFLRDSFFIAGGGALMGFAGITAAITYFGHHQFDAVKKSQQSFLDTLLRDGYDTQRLNLQGKQAVQRIVGGSVLTIVTGALGFVLLKRGLIIC